MNRSFLPALILFGASAAGAATAPPLDSLAGGPASQAGRRQSIVTLNARTGATFFEKSYGRGPWPGFDCGLEIKKQRWGLRSGFTAQRRNYGGGNLRALEYELAPSLKLLSNASASVRLSVSPYRYFDTLYASKACDFEINAGFPAGIEGDAAARLRYYGRIFSPFYSAGAGKYLGRYLLSCRLFLAPFEHKNFVSALLGLRTYSRKTENGFHQIGTAFGRSPFDAGIVTVNGYLSFVEVHGISRIGISSRVWLMPTVSVAGEQLTRKGDFDDDGQTDVSRSPVRMRCSVLFGVQWERER